MASVVNRLDDVGTRSEFIVAGCTSTLQVLDVGINKPFKNYLTASFNDHVIENHREKPTRQNIAQWVSRAWDAISTETITNTWRHIGIHVNN